MNRFEKRRNKGLVGKGAKKTKPIQVSSPISSGQEQTQTIQQAIDLAVQHHQAGDLPKAESVYQQILQADPNQPVALHLLGMIAQQIGKSDIAVDLITKALAIKPDYAEAHSNLGLVLQGTGKLDEAVVSYKKAITIKPDLVEAHSNLGNAFRDLGEFNEAVASYNKALSIKPDLAEAYSNLGNAFHGLGMLDEAVVNYNKAIAIKPDYADAHFNFGVALHELGQFDLALSSYNKAIAIKPDYAEAYANLGIVLKQLGRTDEAVVSYNKALAIKFDDPETLNNLGNAFNSLGQLDEAITSYNKAIAIKPDYAEAHYKLGNIIQKLGQIDAAVVNYNKAIAIKPDYAEAHFNLGNTLRELGQIDEAVVNYNKALAINPDYAEAHNNLGNTLLTLGVLSEAVENFNKALAINPDFAEVHSNMGIAFTSLGQLDEALASLNRALVIKPDFGEARFSLGKLLYECCEFKKAMEQFKLTNFGKSKSYLLKCLYELDEQSPFYDQLDDLINQGEFNSVIGSLCSRSEIRYGINRTNPFCNDPLKYVSQIDLTEQCDFNNIFVKTAKNILNDDTISYKSQSLLANGDQTAGNLLLLKIDFIEEIKRILDSEIEKYRLYFKDSEEGFLRHWPKEYNLHGWLISMKSGGELHPHMHEEGWISGSVYINVPSKVKADCGNLIVCIDDEKYATSAKTNSRKSIDVVTGSLCLFPASLLHYTIPFESEEERIVLAFDVIPKTVGQHTKSNN